MPLDTAGLPAAIEDVIRNHGATEDGAGVQWGNVIRSYTDQIIPQPITPPNPAAMDAAIAPFKTTLTGPVGDYNGFSATGQALTLLNSAFVAYAIAIAATMPQAPSASLPPPLPLSTTLAAVLVTNQALPTIDSSIPVAASNLATAIDAWFRTGLGPTGLPWA